MTIFDKIIAGELSASFVWKDDVCVAFMDISPTSAGHTLVVPRQSVATLAELDAATRAHIWEIANKIAIAQQKALGSKAQHFWVNDGKNSGQSVPHVHIHVLPRYGGDRLKTLAKVTWHVATLALPKPISAATRARLDAQAAAIAEHL